MTVLCRDYSSAQKRPSRREDTPTHIIADQPGRREGTVGFRRACLCLPSMATCTYTTSRPGGARTSKLHPTSLAQGRTSEAHRNRTTPARYQIPLRPLVASASKPSLGS